jgi:hypothetical protein
MPENKSHPTYGYNWSMATPGRTGRSESADVAKTLSEQSRLYEVRVIIEAPSDRSQRASLSLVNPTDAPQTGYCDVGVSSLDVTN